MQQSLCTPDAVWDIPGSATGFGHGNTDVESSSQLLVGRRPWRQVLLAAVFDDKGDALDIAVTTRRSGSLSATAIEDAGLWIKSSFRRHSAAVRGTIRCATMDEDCGLRELGPEFGTYYNPGPVHHP